MENKPESVRFHLENLTELSPDIMTESLDTIADPRVTACLDIGHARCNSTTPVLNWIERLGRRTAYVQLHDNDGTDDQHLAIGGGMIRYKEVCSALNQYSPDAIWALEVETDGIEQSYQWLIDNGFVHSI
jgi:sugar phosphate isomerase/epimerase